MRVLGVAGAVRGRRGPPVVTVLLLGAGPLTALLAGCGGGGQPSQPRPTSRVSAAPTPSALDPGPAAAPTPGTRPPTGFVPATASFPDADDGFAWGVGPCAGASNTFCPGLAATEDGGTTWKLRTAPIGQPTDPDQRAILRFATVDDGWAVTGGALQVTHDGAASWHDVTLPDTTTPQILAIAATSTAVYVVATGTGAQGPLRLFRSAAALDAFTAVPGVSAPATAASVHLAVTETTGALTVDSATDGSPQLFAAGVGGAWTPRDSPCASGDNSAVAAAGPGALAVVCDGSATATGAQKAVWMSTDSGASFTQVGGPAQIGFTASAVSVPAAPASSAAPVEPTSSPSGEPLPGGVFVVAASAREDRLYLTENGGRSWTVAYADSSDGSGSGLGWADLAFSDSADGVAVLGNAGVFVADRLGGRHAVLSPRLLVTSDGGRHWSQAVIR